MSTGVTPKLVPGLYNIRYIHPYPPLPSDNYFVVNDGEKPIVVTPPEEQSPETWWVISYAGAAESYIYFINPVIDEIPQPPEDEKPGWACNAVENGELITMSKSTIFLIEPIFIPDFGYAYRIGVINPTPSNHLDYLVGVNNFPDLCLQAYPYGQNIADEPAWMIYKINPRVPGQPIIVGE